MGYLGLPYLSEPCDNSGCHQRSSPGIIAVYFFPTWLLTRAMVILMKCSSATGPELIVRIPRIVSFEASIFQYVRNEDLCGIKRLFESGLSSPFDVDPIGMSALAVSEAASSYVIDQSHKAQQHAAESYVETCFHEDAIFQHSLA